MAFINQSVGFLRAADAVCHAQLASTAVPVPPEPIHFLFAHALELAFKGYLRASGIPTKELSHPMVGHHLGVLREMSSSLMKCLSADLQRDVLNIIGIFDQSNQKMGLRYFTMSCQTFPELGWARETIRHVVDAAGDTVKALDPLAARVGPAVKVNFTISRPEAKGRRCSTTAVACSSVDSSRN